MKFKTKYFLTILSFLMTLSCSEDSKLKEKYNCIGIDDCLSKFEFEGARAYISLPYDVGNYKERGAHDDGWKNILVSESNYWVKNGDFKKAIEILDADKENYKVGNVFDASGFNKTKYDLISKIIEELLDDNEFNEARKWVLKCPDKHESGIDFREEDGYYKKHKPHEKMRYILNKKIDEFENLSK